jgi:hypothetical protein
MSEKIVTLGDATSDKHVNASEVRDRHGYRTRRYWPVLAAPVVLHPQLDQKPT